MNGDVITDGQMSDTRFDCIDFVTLFTDVLGVEVAEVVLCDSNEGLDALLKI